MYKEVSFVLESDRFGHTNYIGFYVIG